MWLIKMGRMYNGRAATIASGPLQTFGGPGTISGAIDKHGGQPQCSLRPSVRAVE